MLCCHGELGLIISHIVCCDVLHYKCIIFGCVIFSVFGRKWLQLNQKCKYIHVAKWNANAYNYDKLVHSEIHYFKSTLTCLKNQFLLNIIRLQYSVVTKDFCACIAADYNCVLYTNCFCIILTKFPCLSSSWLQWVWCCVNAARWPCCTNSSFPAAFTGKCRLSPALYPSEWTEL